MTLLEEHRIRVLAVASPAGRASRLPECFPVEAGFSVAVREPAGVLAECARQLPDVVVVDVFWPLQPGLQLIREVMAHAAVPVVAVGEGAGDESFERAAIAAGALAAVRRPGPPDDPGHGEQVAALVETVRLMAEVRVVRRRERATHVSGEPGARPAQTAPRIVAIGASTGGPAVLQTIFQSLPAEFPLPIVTVQHIAAGFLPGMLEWLQATSALRLDVARHQEPLLPGHVYFAPDHQQMGVEGLRIVMGAAIEKDGHCPSISHLFCSVAESFGAAAVGVLLTGMGRDGASELLKMRQAGAMTIAQDRDSCVVYGMPGRAAELGAVTRFLPPARMAAALLILAGMGEAQGGT